VKQFFCKAIEKSRTLYQKHQRTPAPSKAHLLTPAMTHGFVFSGGAFTHGLTAR
jgi:hypothetical protein